MSTPDSDIGRDMFRHHDMTQEMGVMPRAETRAFVTDRAHRLRHLPGLAAEVCS
jgi:hypothetical protein